MRLIVLGSTGMLGSEVSRIAKIMGVSSVQVSRTEGVLFDASTSTFDQLAQYLQLGPEDYLVNCIGWIPQKASGSKSEDEKLAQLLNSRLPRQVNEAVLMHGFNWIQIGTDCVFSGSTGGYGESSNQDAEDLYGRSKIAGERLSNEAMLIRTSIIGPDRRTRAGLYSWFLGEMAAGRRVMGYQNHRWNGVSTTAFARLAVGIALGGRSGAFKAHWIPANSKSKLELLKLFAGHLGISGTMIDGGEASRAVDRTLNTDNALLNQELWHLAGYPDTPTIEELVAELVQIDRGKEVD